MAESGVWLTQAESDLDAAKVLRREVRSILNCQVAAKCQQVVEKSVKAITAELSDRRVVALTIGFDHNVDQYVSAILRAPSTRKGAVPDYIKSTFRFNRPTLDELMGLALR